MNLIRIVVVGLIFSVVGWTLLNVIVGGGSAGTGTWLSRTMPVVVLLIWVIAALSFLARRSGRRSRGAEPETDGSTMTYQPPAELPPTPDIPQSSWDNPVPPQDTPVPPADPAA